jgi:hypothetical protein
LGVSHRRECERELRAEERSSIGGPELRCTRPAADGGKGLPLDRSSERSEVPGHDTAPDPIRLSGRSQDLANGPVAGKALEVDQGNVSPTHVDSGPR